MQFKVFFKVIIFLISFTLTSCGLKNKLSSNKKNTIDRPVTLQFRVADIFFIKLDKDKEDHVLDKVNLLYSFKFCQKNSSCSGFEEFKLNMNWIIPNDNQPLIFTRHLIDAEYLPKGNENFGHRATGSRSFGKELINFGSKGQWIEITENL